MSQSQMETPTQEYIEKLIAQSPKDVLRLKCAMRHGDQSKWVSVAIPEETYKSGIEIMHITDVQYGHKACNVPRLIEYRDWVLKRPNRFVVFGGDMVDAAHALSVGSPFENTDEPQRQVYQFVELMAPMRHRIIGYVGGNHERRSMKTFGDLGHLIAMLLRIPYSAGKQFIDVHYGQHAPFKISMWHGGGAARTKGSKAQMLHRFMQQGDSDLYLVGHLHDCMMVVDYRERRSATGEMVVEEYVGAMSSSFLEHYGTYAEVAGLSAGGTNMWRAVLDLGGKWDLTHRVSTSRKAA